MKKKSLIFFVLFFIVVAVGVFWVKTVNNFKRDGAFEISFNDKPIEIIRDNNGIAYVFAENKADVLRGQGFVNAQDRLFQIEFYRALIRGEAASLVGNSMLASDVQMRVLDIFGNAEHNYKYFDEKSKQALNWYCQGYNEYLKVGKDEFPLELKLLGIQPTELKPVDIVSITHFIGFFHSQNMEDEVLSLNLSAHTAMADKLLPLSINLDRTKPLRFKTDSITKKYDTLNRSFASNSNSHMVSYPDFGSNNWAINAEKSSTGKPILCNDPHVDARILPGTFYPVGLFCPEFKAVGIATPGVPGILSGRNEFVAFGVTNAYGDSQDLFIEDIQGDYYMNDSLKLPLDIRNETIKVKDSAAVQLRIRVTERGPVISDFEAFNIKTKADVSLRWSLAESQSKSVVFDKLLDTKNVFEFREALFGMDNNFFNYAIADIHGNIAHQSTGLVPIRPSKNGDFPQNISNTEAWNGFIPKDEMPNMINPERGWIGTANHDTRPDDYPYFYSNHFSPFYRYKRIKEVLSQNKKFTPDDLWRLILDVENTQAKILTPLFVKSLEKNEATKDIATVLERWNYKDDIDEVGATLYNMIYNELLYLLLNDELPDELENQYWENVYYWNQRLDKMILENDNIIDDKNTTEKETLDNLIIEACINAEAILTDKLGSNMEKWTWGEVHTIDFVSPLKQEGFGSGLLGAESFPKKGSNQTLNRGAFIKNKNRDFETSWFSSFRMLADLSDNEKMRGVVSGGSAARVFHPYYKSQLETWKAEKWLPYWLSRKKIIENAAHALILE